MDFFQHRYYRLNKILMTLIGQWPYRSVCARRVFLAGLILISTTQLVPRILALVKYRDDWTIVLDCAPPLLLDVLWATKLIGFALNSKKTLKLLNRIRTDWQLWARDREVNFLHQYAERGMKMALLYAATLYSSLFVVITQPIVPTIVDVILRNGTEPRKFAFPVDYYHLDVQKYYFYIIVYSYVAAYTVSTVIITGDVMLIVYVQHACGIFAAVGHKLERVGNNDASVETGEPTYALDKRDMEHLAVCIDRHNDAIEYANLVEATYTWIFFFNIGCGMILINVVGLEILVRASDPEATTRFILFVLCIMLHFYIVCYISQNMMDHSTGIRLHIHNSQWYRLSSKIQKLLQLMTMRCGVPCQLTAGKNLAMSVETFGLTFRTTVSYFTFVRSMQGL